HRMGDAIPNRLVDELPELLEKRRPRTVPAREEISMADHRTISTESDLASPAVPTTAVTRRSLLGGAGIAVGAVLASPSSMPGIAPAAAQPVSADPRPLDAAFMRRAFEVREVCARNSGKAPIAPHPANGDEARYTNKIGSDSRGLPHDK